jgi:Arc/MetJ-type ribon-helix-helix transcriptional regulator
MAQRISVQMTVSLPPELYDLAMKVARKEFRSKSELVREALRSYIVKKERFASLRARLAGDLKKKGVRTLKDIEDMVDEVRE